MDGYTDHYPQPDGYRKRHASCYRNTCAERDSYSKPHAHSGDDCADYAVRGELALADED
jgi:hypothetical protein